MADDTSNAPEAEETTEGEGAYLDADLTDGQIIALRTTDTDKDSIDEYVKIFVHGPGPKPIEENGHDHSANKAATREFAIQNGLRPTGDVRHVSTKRNRDKVSWDLTYAVPVLLTERVEHPSGPNVVTENLVNDEGEVPANTDGAGHSEDTRKDAAE